MRLHRLDLTRYGIFTGQTIDFGPHRPGEPDLHIIYGPNEAGKSTSLAAFLDLLFRIEKNSRYNFRHPYATMRIGAALEISGRVHEFARIKRDQRSLLNGTDEPVAEEVILAELGGIERGAYRTMFSLDDDTLEAGGESILTSKGDLGELLFAASAGLADLSRTLTDLRTEADGFYKYHARGGELPQLKVELAALKAERERIDTLAPDYARLVDARDDDLRLYETAFAERGAIHARMAEIQRILAALPHLATLRGAREKLSPLTALPEAPPHWADDLPGLQRLAIELPVKVAAVDADIGRIDGELAAIVVDDVATRAAGRFERLDGLRSRTVTAVIDIPVRQRELAGWEARIEATLGRLGRPGEAEPARLLLSAPRQAALDALIGTRSGIETVVTNAQDEYADALHQLGEARAVLQGQAVDGAAATLAPLAATLAIVRGSDHAVRLRNAERRSTAEGEKLAEQMVALWPWQGDATQLARLTVPDIGALAVWKADAERDEALLQRLDADRVRIDGDAVRLEADQQATSDIAGVVTDQEAARIRSQREAAWAQHRRILDAGSADAFEEALRRDDMVMASRLGHERDIARLHETARQLAGLAAERAHIKERLGVVHDKRQRTNDVVASAIRAMNPGLPAATTPTQLEIWLARRGTALAVLAEMSQATREAAAARADAELALERLSQALVAAGIAHDDAAGAEALLASAQAAVDHDGRVDNLRKAVAACEQDVTRRERALQKADAADRRWHAAWSEACSACWLAEAGTPPSPAEVRGLLPALTDLAAALQERSGLAGRIGAMQDDQAGFAAEVAGLAEELSIAVAGREYLDLAQEISTRVQAAAAAQAAREKAMADRDQAAARRHHLAETVALHDGRQAEMTAFFAVASLDEVYHRIRDLAERRVLQAQADQAARDILDAMRLPAIEAVKTALANADRSALEADLEGLTARFEEQDRRTRDLFAAHKAATDRVEAIGADNDVARIEEKRRTVLLEIEDKARHHLRLRVGIAAAERALRAYRDTHRSAMLARASDAFRTISRGAYRSLTTRPEKGGDSLIAISADGASKLAAELSKGTRFQLYLALRVAGYHEFVANRPPLPFIADDILETFDDFRAEEAFRLFGEMAQVGQVIYLTHHQHLCGIAQRLIPGVRIHNLAGALVDTV